jgi:hypothetical protein
MAGNPYIVSVRTPEILDKLEQHPIWHDRAEEMERARASVLVGTGVAWEPDAPPRPRVASYGSVCSVDPKASQESILPALAHRVHDAAKMWRQYAQRS